MGEIDELIAAASEEQRTRKHKSQTHYRPTGPTSRRKFSMLGWLALVVISVALFFATAQMILPVSKDAIQADLNAALDAAHDAVAEYHRLNVSLPTRVPVTALANLVHFERTGSGYRLSASLNGMTLSRDY